ncbi:YceI family protein [uncultured Williamsia sp.]|uniref:YceI family protein n=1 Tax=uncultured Williamsia sp. TaxID=259311 RepID=UPI00260ED81D|nr:YceI family protein [uncultured Williamsia sp.]
MADQSWTLTPSDDATLEIRTGVTGKAATMGHRLTIEVSRWHAVVEWDGGQPTAVELTADLDSIDVVHGEGGITPLLAPEKMVARSNALKTLDAKRFPTVTFRSDTIDATDTGRRLTGTLEIHGVTHDHVVDLAVTTEDERHHLSMESVVRQSDFGIKPYSQLLGAMKVVDEVTVAFSATLSDPV